MVSQMFMEIIQLSFERRLRSAKFEWILGMSDRSEWQWQLDLCRTAAARESMAPALCPPVMSNAECWLMLMDFGAACCSVSAGMLGSLSAGGLKMGSSSSAQIRIESYCIEEVMVLGSTKEDPKGRRSRGSDWITAQRLGDKGRSTWDSSFVPKCPAEPIEMSRTTQEDRAEQENPVRIPSRPPLR